MEIRRVVTYVTSQGVCQFEEWMNELNDKRAIAQILSRIDRVRLGNFGDSKSVGNGVFELRIHLSPGYRVYYAFNGAEIILLLVGGVKKTQPQDIALAKQYYQEFKNDGH